MLNRMSTLQLGLDNLQQEQDNTEYSAVIDWISPLNFPAQQADYISWRQPGTGQWFLDSHEFTTWLETPKKTLFCPGIPGAGKTVIAATAIDHLKRMQSNSKVAVAYIYCNYKAKEDQSASTFLAAILKQLAQGRPVMTEVTDLHERHSKYGTRPSLEDLYNALTLVLSKFSHTYIVVDALDECRNDDDTRHQLLNKLRALQQNGDVRLMATSRFIPDIEAEFETAMKLEILAREEDIERFVAGQIHRLPKCIRTDDKLQAEVQSRIAKAAEGMYVTH